MKSNMRRILYIFFTFFLSTNFSLAQYKTLTPKYNPVILNGLAFTDSLKIENWSMFLFDAQTESWQAIPFQMDELNGKGEFLEENDGFLDANDELLFMPNDAGDKASAIQWPNFAESNERIEIEIMDLIDSELKGWVYLYKNIRNKPNPPGYFKYIPNIQNSSADTIQTKSYKVGHNNRGWTDFVSLSNNWKKDLIDRIKFHTNGGGGFVPQIHLTEDTLTLETKEFFERPIRSFQKVKTKFVLPFLQIEKEDNLIVPYYPYFTEIGGGFSVSSESKYILVLLQIQNIRLSIDLNPELKNMFFYSAINPNGFPIDGKPDSPNILVPDLKNLNWVMASGAEGTIMALFNFPEVQGAKGKFVYHRDNLNGGTNEGMLDTGDQVSFGDIGLWLRGEALVPESSSLYVSFTTYYINEANKDASFGNQIIEEVNNPLQTKITYQSKPTSVEDRNYRPSTFGLQNVYPNPFYQGKEIAVFQFILQNLNQTGVFTIYNLLGQIERKVNLDDLSNQNGTKEFKWNGTREDGSYLPAGIYFYQLKTGDQIQTKKFLVM